MAEDQNEAQDKEKKSSPLSIKNIIMFGSAIVVPVILAFVIFSKIITPTITDDGMEDPTPEIVDPFPATMTEVPFDEQQVSVRTEDPDMVPPILIEQVTFMCQDGPTATLIEARKSLFTAKVLMYHQGRTRAELNDTLVKNSILEQIKQQANILLRRLDPEADLKVLDVLHVKYMIVDL